MNKKLAIFLTILAFFFIQSSCEKKKAYNGYVEGEFQYVSATTSGLLNSLAVKRGEKIGPNHKLFEIDETELKTSIQSAKSEISKARAALKEAERNFGRASNLSKQKVVSEAEFDLRNSQYEAAISGLEEAKQKFISLEKKMKEAKPFSDSACFVQETFFVEGEFVAAGKPVVSLLSRKNIKIRFFVSQANLNDSHLGKKIFIKSDSCGKNAIEAEITYISSQAEFTPPVIFNKTAREKFVFMIEAKPIYKSDEKDKEWGCLIPGLPVDVYLN
jgi:HlyD family secretion protein